MDGAEDEDEAAAGWREAAERTAAAARADMPTAAITATVSQMASREPEVPGCRPPARPGTGPAQGPAGGGTAVGTGAHACGGGGAGGAGARVGRRGPGGGGG